MKHQAEEKMDTGKGKERFNKKTPVDKELLPFIVGCFRSITW